MTNLAPTPDTGWSRFMQSSRTALIAYARWLDSISWKRFLLLALLAMIATGVLSGIPPFSTTWGGREVQNTKVVKRSTTPRAASTPTAPPAPAAPSDVPAAAEPPASAAEGKRNITLDIKIDEGGVRIQQADPAPSAASDAASHSGDHVVISIGGKRVVTASSDQPEVAELLREIKAEMAQRRTDSQGDDPAENAEVIIEEILGLDTHTEGGYSLGRHMPDFMFFLIVISGVIKLMAAGRFKAEAQAEEAQELAQEESLKRQVVEARMAAMQAQVEPHFLFNTLASIEHLIETDPARASVMQRNLIALLRASMPSLRESGAASPRPLGRELDLVRPYLEILKVRMEDRLHTDIRVSEGLMSAEFPPMMLQGLVENAIKHGLEPKAEGGQITLSADIEHGKLVVSVVDTGVGFGQAMTAGSGIGLNNIRERLQLLYGKDASLVVSETAGGGTTARITIPYRTAAPN